MYSVCEVGTVAKISDYQPEGPRFSPRSYRGLNFGQSSFATPGRRVQSLNVLSGDLNEPTHLSIRVLWTVCALDNDEFCAIFIKDYYCNHLFPVLHYSQLKSSCWMPG